MKLKDIFDFNIEKRDASEVATPVNPVLFGENSFLFGSYSHNGAAQSLSVVFRCTELISNAIASLPINIVDENDKDCDNYANHPLTLYFRDKNKNTVSKFNGIKGVVRDVLLKGNGYMFIVRGADGTPTNLRYLPANRVTLLYDEVKDRVTYTCPLVSKKTITSDDMLHFKMVTNDGVNGISILSLASRSIGIGQSTEDGAKDYYDNGGMLSGIITTPVRMSPEQRRDYANTWNSTFGNGKAQGIAVLEGGATYQQVSSTAEQQQMLESRKYNVVDIARYFGINPMLLGDNEHNVYSSLEQILNDFLTNCLTPYIKMMEGEMNRKLFSNDEMRVDFDETFVLKTDKSATASYFKTLLSTGVLCINEARKELGYAPIEDGDKHIIAYTDINQNTINKTEKDDKDI